MFSQVSVIVKFKETQVCVTLPKLSVTEVTQGCVSLLGLSCRLMDEDDLTVGQFPRIVSQKSDCGVRQCT